MVKEAEIKFLQVQNALKEFKSLSENFMFEKGASIQKISEMKAPQLDADKDFKRHLE